MKDNLEDNIVDVEDISSIKLDFDLKDRVRNLRSWAMKYIKESFIILLTYGVWVILFQFAFDRGGFSALCISVSIAILYKLDRVNKK